MFINFIFSYHFLSNCTCSDWLWYGYVKDRSKFHNRSPLDDVIIKMVIQFFLSPHPVYLAILYYQICMYSRLMEQLLAKYWLQCDWTMIALAKIERWKKTHLLHLMNRIFQGHDYAVSTIGLGFLKIYNFGSAMAHSPGCFSRRTFF